MMLGCQNKLVFGFVQFLKLHPGFLFHFVGLPDLYSLGSYFLLQVVVQVFEFFFLQRFRKKSLKKECDK